MASPSAFNLDFICKELNSDLKSEFETMINSLTQNFKKPLADLRKSIHSLLEDPDWMDKLSDINILLADMTTKGNELEAAFEEGVTVDSGLSGLVSCFGGTLPEPFISLVPGDILPPLDCLQIPNALEQFSKYAAQELQDLMSDAEKTLMEPVRMIEDAVPYDILDSVKNMATCLNLCDGGGSVPLSKIYSKLDQHCLLSTGKINVVKAGGNAYLHNHVTSIQTSQITQINKVKSVFGS